MKLAGVSSSNTPTSRPIHSSRTHWSWRDRCAIKARVRRVVAFGEKRCVDQNQKHARLDYCRGGTRRRVRRLTRARAPSREPNDIRDDDKGYARLISEWSASIGLNANLRCSLTSTDQSCPNLTAHRQGSRFASRFDMIVP